MTAAFVVSEYISTGSTRIPDILTDRDTSI
jgi:hypothetical protein